jgi:ABC-type sugar transport system ATPase subunit
MADGDGKRPPDRGGGMSYLLEAREVTKAFPGVLALNKVSLGLSRGEVHALVGENGAGKSTFIKIVCGVYQPTEGTLYWNSHKVSVHSPAEALRLGIVPVHQELNLEPYLSVAENIFIGRQPKNRFGLIDHRRMNEMAVSWLEELGMKTEPTAPVGMISVAERQMVSIARAVSLNASMVIFDEPTASLTRRETELLFEVIRRLRLKGLAVIFISHRMEEIFGLCDLVTIMRDGNVIATSPVSGISTDEIIRKMIGRDLRDMFKKERSRPGDPVLEVRGLTVPGVLRNVSLRLRKGEILGIAGLVGAGRTELARAIVGDLKYDSGSLLIEGRSVQIRNPMEAIKAGIGLVPEERKELGLVLGLSVKKNISIAILRRLSRLGIVRARQETKIARTYVDRLSIKTPSLTQGVQYLSGGNQQRVVIAKWLATTPKILIVDEPTRGIDVGAKAEMHALLNDLAKQGVSIIMISSELPEVLAMSDRILVMHEGEIVAELEGATTSEEEVLRYATGELRQEAGLS